jgi:hypothetical protein
MASASARDSQLGSRRSLRRNQIELQHHCVDPLRHVFDAAQEADRLVDSLGDIVVLYPDDADD